MAECQSANAVGSPEKQIIEVGLKRIPMQPGGDVPAPVVGYSIPKYAKKT